MDDPGAGRQNSAVKTLALALSLAAILIVGSGCATSHGHDGKSKGSCPTEKKTSKCCKR